MQSFGVTAVGVRFLLGLSGAVAAGLFAFGADVFRPDARAFHCWTIGAFTAGILALLRSDRLSHAVGLTFFFSVVQFGRLSASGWRTVAASMFLVCGILLAGLIFDQLGRRGILFGKFLLVGLLLGGLYLAATPLAEFHAMEWPVAAGSLLRNLFLGVVLGDGAGLGVECADLLLMGGRKRTAASRGGATR